MINSLWDFGVPQSFRTLKTKNEASSIENDQFFQDVQLLHLESRVAEKRNG